MLEPKSNSKICSRWLASILLLSSSFASHGLYAQQRIVQKPKLVLVLVVDQFRADQLARFEGRFLPAKGPKAKVGGYRYLTEQGAHFPFAEYGNLQNMTCPGHATILSGAFAYQNGISTNIWYDKESGESRYCVVDQNTPLVGNQDKGDGVSPRNLLASTVGDELKNSGYKSKVVAIALKDRSSVMLGGHRADLALWYEPKSLRWISSRYYLPDGTLPTWLANHNAELEKKYSKQVLTWELTAPNSELSLPSNDMLSKKGGVEEIGSNFPHKVAANTWSATLLPFGVEITVDLAIKALDSYKLGQGKAPDILAVSLSNHDFVSHAFGPNSREVEEITVTEDRQIARLLQHVQTEVGLDNTVIVFTADHGAPPSPEWLKSQKMPAGRVDGEALLKSGEEFLRKKFGKAAVGTWIHAQNDFNFYLNHKALQAGGLDLALVQDSLRDYFRSLPQLKDSVAYVFSGADVKRRTLPPNLHEKQIIQTYSDIRSGDVLLIPRPYFMSPGSTTTHMTGYAYDRMVPLIFAGRGIKSGRYAERAEVVDIAPTLSFITGTLPPSGSEGRVLSEIFEKAKP